MPQFRLHSLPLRSRRTCCTPAQHRWEYLLPEKAGEVDRLVEAMGAACSTVAQPSERSALRRASFTNLRTQGSAKSRTMKAGTDFTESYSLGDQVGSDEAVMLATNVESEVEHVARLLDKGSMPMDANSGDVEEHLLNLARLDHVHVCRFIEAFEHEDQVQLVYEKATSENLFEQESALEAGRPLNEEAVQNYCRQIASGLRVAHKNGIVHGRLSPTSLLLDPSEQMENHIKICDIGQTFILRPQRDSKYEYEAPETLWDEFRAPSDMTQFSEELKIFASIDMWALGVLVYRMLTGKLPFDSGKPGAGKEAVKTSAVEFGSEWAKMPDAREVVHGLLRHNGRIRTPAEKVLKHPWLTLSKEYISRAKMIRVLQNVVYNTQESTFKKFALRVIAEDMNHEKLEVVQKAFQRIDKNNDGTLELHEITAVLRKYVQDDDQNTDEIFEAIDRDASGSLNFAEFCAVSIGRPEYCEKETLWHAFNRFDRDGNGMFEKEEIALCLREVEHLAEGAQVTAEVEEIAGDIAMPVDFDTFVHIMITPAGIPINGLACNWDKMCYTVLKVDNHKVRHINPRRYPLMGSPLRKSPYAKKSIGNMFTETEGEEE